jgi:hypothetical protein
MKNLLSMSIYFYTSSCIAMWMLLSVVDEFTTYSAALVFLWPLIWPVYVISALLENAPS